MLSLLVYAYMLQYIYIERERYYIYYYYYYLYYISLYSSSCCLVVQVVQLSSCPAARPSLFLFLMPLLYYSIIAPIILSLAELISYYSAFQAFQLPASSIPALLYQIHETKCFVIVFKANIKHNAIIIGAN